MAMLERASNSEQAARYFDGQAASYRDRSTSGFWKFIRSGEANRILELIGNPAGQSVLDLGSGAGHYATLFAVKGAAEVWAIDLSEQMINAIPDSVHGIVGDIASCDLDRSFSRIVCAGAMEFVDEPVDVFRNAYRHAEPGARMVVLVPHATLVGRLYKRYHRQHGLTARLFSSRDLGAIASAAGWQTETIKSVLPFALVGAFRRPN